MLESIAPARDVIRYLRAMLDADPVPLERIGARSLPPAGAADQFFGNGVMEETASRIPDAELTLITRETHIAPVERSRAFADSMAAFPRR